MQYQHITYVVEDNVAIITLNRPDVLNSFHMEMARELQEILRDVNDNSEVRCALLTGGGRAFCAGQDLAEATKNPEEEKILGDFVEQMYNPIVRGIRNTPKPVVCAVNGVAAGAGANLALACDIVFASDRASFIQSFCKIGLVPDTAGSFFLPRLIGFGRASALMLLGDKISAQQALDMGMIYRVVENDCLLEEATETARYLATQPTKGLGYIKQAMNRSLVNDLEAQLNAEKELQTLAGQTQDYKEGVQAFLEKRKPKFMGN
ncbi:enoyl-CoA hydratase-related protein [Candidatus Uabimicrobium amorphum]|uniref:2-(1,2-epoxy-1,2-dihydrophenyl)acetyl-CoAisomerase n=1 Tax=Uabimicrobium amorphum TaxID=2596890 RepID=A0A5S9IJU8_UABAM|nr:enoyl-CoA hydratase-related protein [Candidatus Uabimicrobium amorphum]BBM83034.1 2-(1,2-epoxy-1,2-dihydrophenyl)acetyl-CoAisomerase [Candidatus Uabimicrobium amorphum]